MRFKTCTIDLTFSTTVFSQSHSSYNRSKIGTLSSQSFGGVGNIFKRVVTGQVQQKNQILPIALAVKPIINQRMCTCTDLLRPEVETSMVFKIKTCFVFFVFVLWFLGFNVIDCCEEVTH